MGGFYGSVQVRSTDRDRVRSVLEELAGAEKRFLLGPTLNGWVGVYPNGGGQDLRVARDLARRLGGELIAPLVHDDCVFAYEYYRDGQCVDRYNSIPDYFGNVSEAERGRLVGHPETFAHLALDQGKFAALVKRMAANAQGPDFAALSERSLLEVFAEALGIRNVMTSYEYMTENEETDDIDGWKQFVHVPDQTDEKVQKKAAKAALAKQKKLLIEQGQLLAERGGLKGWESPAPHFCEAPDRHGFLVAWSSHADPPAQQIPVELHGAPWSGGPQATHWAISPKIFGMELSPSGRYLAVAHASGDWKATLWDLERNRFVAEASQVRAVTSVGFLADESAMYSASSDSNHGRLIITPVGPGEPRVIEMPLANLAAAHPNGEWFAVADGYNRLHLLEFGSARIVRTHPIGDPGEMYRQLLARIEKLRKDGVKIPESFENVRKQFEDLMSTSKNWELRSGTEKVFRLRFDRDGKWLFMATSAGARVYSWQNLLDSEALRPAFSVDASAMTTGFAGGEMAHGSYIYDLAHDESRNRLLFAGLDGRVRFLDLDSGKSGVLLEPPGLPPIHRLGLSRDGATLALKCTPELFNQSLKRRGPVLQFWDYEAITKG